MAHRQREHGFIFLLHPGFALLPLAAAIAPLHKANALAGAALYRWRLATPDGAAARAGNGVVVMPDGPLAPCGPDDVLMVCAPANATVPAAGGGAAAVHVLAGEQVATAGGLAPQDVVIGLIGQQHGLGLAAQVVQGLRGQIACAAVAAPGGAAGAGGAVHHPGLAEAMAQMAAGIEQVLPVEDIAARAGMSIRQLERLFRAGLGTTPSRYYLRLRLDRARALLRDTAKPIGQVAVLTGFASAAHFTTCYREAFGQTPGRDRRAARLVHGSGGPGGAMVAMATAQPAALPWPA